MKSMKILCVIPARGGSKRIPRKNMVPVAGKPLISYTIEAAVTSGVFNEIAVSSDEAEILAIAGEFGVKPMERPARLAGDLTRAVEVVEDYLCLEETEGFQFVAMLLPTCPFRDAQDIQKAVRLIIDNEEFDFLTSVAPYDFPPQLALCLDKDGKMLTMREQQAYEHSTRSQSYGKYYRPNGAIYIAKVNRFLAEKTFFVNPMLAYVMPPERSFDIDTFSDLKIAEAMASNMDLGGDVE